MREAGGDQVVDRQSMEDVGSFSYFKDPEGNVFGAMQPAGPPPRERLARELTVDAAPDPARVVVLQLGGQHARRARSGRRPGAGSGGSPVMPTDVCPGAVVAGYGPPWCMPWVDRDAGREAVEQHAAGAAREQRRQLGDERRRRARVHGAGELALEARDASSSSSCAP